MAQMKCSCSVLVLPILLLASGIAAAATPDVDELSDTVKNANSYLLAYASLSPKEQSAQSKAARKIANERRKALKNLILQGPERALELRLSPIQRVGLPEDIIKRLERIIVAAGDFVVVESDLVEPNVEHGLSRLVYLDNEVLQAAVYGRRLTQGTKYGIPINGIAFGDRLAFSDFPLYVLDELEVKEQGLEPGTIAALASGQLLTFDSEDEFDEIEFEFITTESGPGPFPGGAIVTFSGGPWTLGLKFVLVILVDFSDLPGLPHWIDGTPLTKESALAEVNQAGDFLEQVSDGNTSLLSLAVPVIVRAPNPASFYRSMPFLGDGTATLALDAEQAARDFDDMIGMDGFYNPDSYDRVVIAADGVWQTPSGDTARGGAAVRGGEWVVTHGVYNWRLLAHELGHTYNLIHSSAGNVTSGADPLAVTEIFEYSDAWDVMGSAGFDFNGHYNVYFKQFLGWLSGGSVADVTSSGTHRLYAHDQVGATGVRALRVDAGPDRAYWVGARRNYPETSTGVEIRYEQKNVRWPMDIALCSVLLDAHPPVRSGGDTDHTFRVGEMINDIGAGVMIQVMAVGTDSTGQYADVLVTLTP